MNNYLELAQLSDGTIVLRRSDDKENPLVKIKFSGESKQLLQGQELHIAKEMIRAGMNLSVVMFPILMSFLIRS